MVSIAILVVYFGKFPEYFDIWLRSAEMNPTIDFILFTDQERKNLPSNVKFIKMNLNEMKKKAQKLFDFKISLERPYKCCDFRPIYGLIFNEYINKYDYWGHCDLDLVWGDIRGFVEKNSIEKYDKFLPLGHLCIYRNNEVINNAFKLKGAEPRNYKKIFSTPYNYAFDEQGIRRIFEQNGLNEFKGRIFADISKIYKRFKLALNDKNYDYQIFFWENGKVYRQFKSDGVFKKEEFIYIHFKERGIMPKHGDCLGSQRIYVCESGFYASDPDEITEEIVDKYNPFPGKKVEAKEYNLFMRKEKINFITRKITRLLHIQKIR